MPFWDARRGGTAGSDFGQIETPFLWDWPTVLIEAVCLMLLGAVLAWVFLRLKAHLKLGTLYQASAIALLVLLGFVILVVNFSYAWSDAIVRTEAQYKAYSPEVIAADVRLRVGLRGVNISMVGQPSHQVDEKIDYMEHFSWEWEQGRLGFGPFAGRIQRDFRRHQFRGTPLPILSVAEYFTLDGENIRWGRYHRLAGYFSVQLLWITFAIYCFTVLLFFMASGSGKARFYAGCGLLTVGLFMVGIAIFYSLFHSWRGPPLKIPLGSAVLIPTLGWTWYLCLTTGMLSIVGGLLVIWSVLYRSWQEFSDHVSQVKFAVFRPGIKVAHHLQRSQSTWCCLIGRELEDDGREQEVHADSVLMLPLNKTLTVENRLYLRLGMFALGLVAVVGALMTTSLREDVRAWVGACLILSLVFNSYCLLSHMSKRFHPQNKHRIETNGPSITGAVLPYPGAAVSTVADTVLALATAFSSFAMVGECTNDLEASVCDQENEVAVWFWCVCAVVTGCMHLCAVHFAFLRREQKYK